MSYTVYIDTSIIKLLTLPPSRDQLTRACQQLTRRWWRTRRNPKRSFSSAYVENEIKADVPLLAQSRLILSAQNQFLYENSATEMLGELLILGGGLSSHARTQAEHIACAAMNQVDVLLSWNCVDIVNPAKFRLMRMIMRSHELRLPELVTPFALMERNL